MSAVDKMNGSPLFPIGNRGFCSLPCGPHKLVEPRGDHGRNSEHHEKEAYLDEPDDSEGSSPEGLKRMDTQYCKGRSSAGDYKDTYPAQDTLCPRKPASQRTRFDKEVDVEDSPEPHYRSEDMQEARNQTNYGFQGSPGGLPAPHISGIHELLPFGGERATPFRILVACATGLTCLTGEFRGAPGRMSAQTHDNDPKQQGSQAQAFEPGRGS